MTEMPGETLARLVADIQAARDKAMEKLELQEEVGVTISEEVKKEAEIMTSRPFGSRGNVFDGGGEPSTAVNV